MTDRINLAEFALPGHPGYVSGNWYQPVRGTVSIGNSPGADKIQLIPFMLEREITVSELGCRVTNAVSGGNVQLALYAADPVTHKPTGNVLASTGNLSTAAFAAVSGDVADVTLEPGLYWMASNHSAALSALQTVSTSFAQLASMIGSPTLGNITISNSSAALILTVPQTFGTWPDLTSATFTEGTQQSSGGLVYLKAA